jgi:hypothetical protein
VASDGPAAGQRAVQRVVHVARPAAFGIGEAGAVGRRIVGVARREVAPREEGLAGGRRREPPHVVKRELVRAGGVRHLRQAAVVVVGVIHGRGIRIGFLRQPVQLVVTLGARGLLGVTDDAATDTGFHYDDLGDPATNVDAGSTYVGICIHRNHGNVRNGLIGYGTGRPYANSLLNCEECLIVRAGENSDCKTKDCLEPLHPAPKPKPHPRPKPRHPRRPKP